MGKRHRCPRERAHQPSADSRRPHVRWAAANFATSILKIAPDGLIANSARVSRRGGLRRLARRADTPDSPAGSWH